jgi:hypothetical protein
MMRPTDFSERDSALRGLVLPSCLLAALLAARSLSAQATSLPAEPAQQAPTAEPAQQAPAAAQPSGAPRKPPRLRDLCRQEPGSTQMLDETRRLLEETFCGATLWFDGLFGGEPDVTNAREVSGRLELSALHTDFAGTDLKARLHLNYSLPTLERRFSLFLGRDNRDQFVEDRREGLAIRSSFFGLDTEDNWLAGLGYSPPGEWESKVDFRVGARLKSAPEVFAQSRYRRNLFRGTRDVWRFRETVFWENRQGFGSTTSLDFDRVLRRDLLLRWGNIGTFSESTQGLTWRSAALAYHNLLRSRAVALELFARGATGAEVKLQEYGSRAIYRQPVGKPYLFGELIVGYTWPREQRFQPRQGSAMLGLGLELHFGREPY